MTDTLMNLIDDYAESRHINGCWVYNSKTASARQAVIEALSVVQTLSAAPGVGNSGFDHQTAADFLSGKTVSDEAVRKFVQASRWAHDEKAALSAMLLSVRGVLASREAEIALLKKALMKAEAAPQQEPYGYVFAEQYAPTVGSELKTTREVFTRVKPDRQCLALYTAPQPAPAPLREREAFEAWIKKDGGDLGTFGTPPNMYYRNSAVNNAWVAWKARAALAAQGGKDA